MMATNDWDDLAARWDSDDDVRSYAEKAFDSWTRKVAPLVSDLPDCRILDFGCGTGLLTEKLATVCGHVVAVDTSKRMIEVLRRKVEAGIGNITAEQIPLSAATLNRSAELAGKFDLIVASSVCSFLPDYEATLRYLSSLLKPGGYFVQWDWLADMPAERIRCAFDASGLVGHGIEEEFALNGDEDSMPVVMGIGRLGA